MNLADCPHCGEPLVVMYRAELQSITEFNEDEA